MDYFLKPLGVAVGLVFIGNLFGKWGPLIRRFALPGAVLGGLIGLLVGPQLLAIGSSVLGAGEEAQLYGSLRQFPSIFINVVFACLMLGRGFAPPARIWRRARRQIVMGHIYARGQYVVGFLLFFALLAPFSDLPPLVAPEPFDWTSDGSPGAGFPGYWLWSFASKRPATAGAYPATGS